MARATDTCKHGVIEGACDVCRQPSEGALRAARAMCQDRKVYVHGGLPEFCGHNYGWADEEEIARLIDREIARTETV